MASGAVTHLRSSLRSGLHHPPPGMSITEWPIYWTPHSSSFESVFNCFHTSRCILAFYAMKPDANGSALIALPCTFTSPLHTRPGFLPSCLLLPPEHSPKAQWCLGSYSAKTVTLVERPREALCTAVLCLSTLANLKPWNVHKCALYVLR